MVERIYPVLQAGDGVARLGPLRLAWLALVPALASLRVSSAHAQADFQQPAAQPEAPPPKPAPVLTRAPRLKKEPAPVYPPEALAAGTAADVTLQIDIDAKGLVTAVKVTRPAGQGFDEAAEAAAADMEFEPAEIDGKPAAIRIEYVMHFRAQVVEKPPEVSAPAAPEVPPSALPARKALVARGRIREKGTRDPVVGADVAVQRAPSAAGEEAISEVVATTDEDGRFVLEGVPGERVRLVIAGGEHEPCVRDLVLPGPGAPPLEIACTVARRAQAYETVVEAPREGDEVTRHTLSQPELTTVPGTFGDPLRVIQNLPGIARSPYGLGLLLIRGASPQDSGVYVDGHKVPLLYHFAVGPSVLTPDLIERIDFFPGGFGVRYGRATAGVVDVTTRTEPLKRAHGSADVDFLDSSAYLEGPVGGGFSGAVAARRSYVDALLPLVLPDSEVVAAPVYWDYQARLGRDLGGGQRLSFFAFGSHDSLHVVQNDPNRGDIELGTTVGFHRLIASWRRPLGSKWTSRLSPAYGYDAFGFSAGMVAADLSAHVLGLREDLLGTLAPSLKLAVGVDAELRFDGVNFNVPLPPERRTYGQVHRPIATIARTLTNAGLAGYLEALWDVTPALRVVPGLRFDWFHYTATEKAGFDPRLVVRWAPGARTAFKAGVGVFHQPPGPQQLDREFGNPELHLLWADQYHIGLEQGLTDALSLDATAYYVRRHDLPVRSSRMDASGGVERYSSEGRGRSYGLEVLLKHQLTRNFFGWIAYTLSRSEQILRIPQDPNEPLPPFRPTQFDQTHNLIVVASQRFGAWELGARFRLVSGIPETPVVGGFYDTDYNDWDPVNGEPLSIRRQTFHQLDLRAERTWVFESWRFSAYLDVQNVYNAENPEATFYDYRFRESGPVRGLPVLPILGVRGRF
jgi:TonB family protein